MTRRPILDGVRVMDGAIGDWGTDVFMSTSGRIIDRNFSVEASDSDQVVHASEVSWHSLQLIESSSTEHSNVCDSAILCATTILCQHSFVGIDGRPAGDGAMKANRNGDLRRAAMGIDGDMRPRTYWPQWPKRK